MLDTKNQALVTFVVVCVNMIAHAFNINGSIIHSTLNIPIH